jgi:hypothetical protein
VRESRFVPKDDARIATTEGTNSEGEIIGIFKHATRTSGTNRRRSLILAIDQILEISNRSTTTEIEGGAIGEGTISLAEERALSLRFDGVVNDKKMVLVRMLSTPTNVEQSGGIKND